MKRTAWTLILLLGLSVCAAAQKKSLCPKVTITGPPGLIPSDGTVEFVASVIPSDGFRLNYNWTVEKGLIESGQGTPNLKVRLPERGLTISAALKVTGLPNECLNNASEGFADIIDPGRTKLDDFIGSLNSIPDERFKKIAAAIKADPNVQIYVFVPPDSVVRRAFSTRMINLSQEDLTRITFIDSSSKNSLVQVWLVPPGATPPVECDHCELPEKIPPPILECPTLEVTGPTGVTPAGNIMPFVVLVSEPRLKNLTFSWTTSAGTIVEGQTMRVVKIKAPAQKSRIDLTATVHIGGLPQGCQDTASATRPVAGS